MSRTSFFLYSSIPGVWKGWTLAVCAVGRRDADTYVHNVHHGGKFVQSVTGGGTVKADCGATTEAAQQVLHDELERWLNEAE
jgi:hypothetical protein